MVGLPNRLFLQRADGTVEDVSKSAGVDWNAETHSGLFLDLDNDGDQDLVVATVLGVVFAENDGSAKFAARTVKLIPKAPPMSLAASDFDADGDLDVFACCYSNRISTQIMGRPIPYHDANNGGRNVLFRNDQDWRFQDVTRAVGLDQNNRRFSFAAAWEDYDNDGDLDLYVANDYGRNNLFRNDQAHFVDVAAQLGVEDMSAGMSVSWGDFNLDGWMDLYVSNMWSSAGNRIAYQRSSSRRQIAQRDNTTSDTREATRCLQILDPAASPRSKTSAWPPASTWDAGLGRLGWWTSTTTALKISLLSTDSSLRKTRVTCEVFSGGRSCRNRRRAPRILRTTRRIGVPGTLSPG